MISIIVAMDKKGGIGYKNKLPWKIPEELKYFKKQTLGKTIVMGRKTFISIGRPLKDRQNIVLTKDKNFKVDNVDIAFSPEEALKKAKSEEVMIIGGLEVYQAFLPLANRLYISLIDGEYECDVYFPKIDFNKWRLVSKEKYEKFITQVWQKIL